MLFSNIDFTVKYLDPSAESGEERDGGSPDMALNAFPTDINELGNNTAWIIRRTPESSFVQLPQGTSDSIQNLLIIGMPKESDTLWAVVPEEARTAWGADEAEYANILANTGDDPWSGDYSFTLSAGKTFLFHRIYLFRENTSAYQSILRFPATDYTAEISFEHCKFGCKGIDLDSAAYTASAGSGSSGLFLYVNTAHVFALNNCIVNIVNGYNDYYGDTQNAIQVNNAKHFSVSDVDVYSTTSEYGGDYGPSGGTALSFSNGSGTGAYGNYQNLRFHILVNGTWGYIPAFFYCYGNSYCAFRNITATIEERHLGEGTPTKYELGGYLIRCHSSREFLVENITVALPKCWRISESYRCVSISGWANSTIPGMSKVVKNITISMAETDGIDSENNGNYYEWVKRGHDDIGYYSSYAALELQFSDRSYSEGAWEPVSVKDITVNHPHGVALYGYGCQIKNCTIKGAVKLRRCVADIASVESYYPGYALFVAEATTLKVGTLTLGKANADVTGGADDPAVGSRYSDSGFIYVETSNGALKSNIGETATNVDNSYNFICGNEVDTGHYTCRSCNYICDTWNAHRIGGSPAVWKFTSSANGNGGMTLGRAPFKGIQITPSTTGKHHLTMHVAAKGLTSMDDMNRLLLMQVTVPQTDGTQKVLFSSVHGQWQDDSAAEWVNDSEMEQRKIVIPLNIATVDTPLDVKIHYQLYSASGYVYIDPVMELTAIE